MRWPERALLAILAVGAGWAVAYPISDALRPTFWAMLLFVLLGGAVSAVTYAALERWLMSGDRGQPELERERPPGHLARGRLRAGALSLLAALLIAGLMQVVLERVDLPGLAELILSAVTVLGVAGAVYARER